MTASDVAANSTLFVYAKEGTIQCLFLPEACSSEPQLLEDGWKHTATINPKVWIEKLCNCAVDPSDMLDALQFTKPPSPAAAPHQSGEAAQE